jgi:ABC-type lipoprotein release transport system permease subunit
VALLERLSVEQRVGQIGMMSAMGFTKGRIRNLLMAEGVIVLLFGCILGAFGSIGAAWLMILGLKTVWVKAVGTTALNLYVDKTTLFFGCVGGVLVGIVAIWRGVASLRSLPIVGMMRGRIEPERPRRWRGRMSAVAAAILAIGALVVIAVSARSDVISAPIAFYTAGVLLLCALLCVFKAMMGSQGRSGIFAPGPFRFLGLGIRNASRNPSRSLLTVGLLASAVFIISAVGSMREDARSVSIEKGSGTGGYSLIAECDIPVPYSFDSAEGRKYLAISEEPGPWDRASVAAMRSSLGDDVSCRNLYRPGNPRVMSVPDSLIDDGAFSFVYSLGKSKNPWELLKEPVKDGAIPVIADYETAQWILHKKLGDIIQVADERGRNRDLRIVAMLRKSIFQSELLMSQSHFRELFPSRSGFDSFLIRVNPEDVKRMETVLYEALDDFGVDIATTQERLESFFEIANTYISAFEALGGLGMILGGLGLVIVLARGIIERRGELALLSAVGFKRRTIAALVALENGILLLFGILIGTIAAAVSVFSELVKNYAREGWVSFAGRILPGWMIAMTVTIAIIAMVVVSYLMVRKTSARSLRVE